MLNKSDFNFGVNQSNKMSTQNLYGSLNISCRKRQVVKISWDTHTHTPVFNITQNCSTSLWKDLQTLKVWWKDILYLKFPGVRVARKLTVSNVRHIWQVLWFQIAKLLKCRVF